MTTEAEPRAIRKLLVANRGEIAIRILRAAAELELATVAIYSAEDRFALHRYKADESFLVGDGRTPVQAYLDGEDIVRIALEVGADAIHPGYGFLAENPDFADAVRAAGLIFVGPTSAAMRELGNKVAARELAARAGVPTIPATAALARDPADAAREAAAIGFPLMLKASWGGGGRGMRVVRDAAAFAGQLELARQEAAAAFGNDELSAERYVERARHVEVQIVGDAHGTVVQLGERDCSVQRRHQKVVEEAPARDLAPAIRAGLHASALAIGRAVAYDNAGTVEFLVDLDRDAYYFIEVNPRIQVEHTVTELVTGIDLVKAQIAIAGGAAIGDAATGIPAQAEISLRGHAIQCRVTTEDAENNFAPTYGQIAVYRPATGFGVRLDGAAYAGAVITPFYDSLLEKVTVWAPTFAEARLRMLRALREFRVRGVATNIAFLDALLSDATFRDGRVTTRFLDESLGQLHVRERRDRATRLLDFVGETIVNGNPEVRGRAAAETRAPAPLPALARDNLVRGTRNALDVMGPNDFARWMRDERRVLVTDTTMRDAHQSLLATRMRTYDLLAIAPAYARLLPELFSIECWGGATFDVAMRFLKEDPWLRLRALRAAIPNVLLQMLVRGANAVGYTSYPDNAVAYFIERAAAGGIDLFRVFDSLNWVENMSVSIDAVIASGKLCEATMCYTGDLLDPARTKYDLRYYVELAKRLEATGAHILGVKDMAGLLKPEAARRLFAALREETTLPIHFHTHDTSGNSGASVLAAVEAGVDAVDGAIDAMSGLTSQPNLGTLVAALRNGERDTGLSADGIHAISRYWEGVRRFYRPFESEMRAGSSDVYEHEMPGGQYTNLREQANGMGLAERWPDVMRTYAEVNAMFGDIPKVTPSSKVVGDLAILMVSGDVTRAQVEDPNVEVAFPQSVVEYFQGYLGRPPGGFPPALREKVLAGRPAIYERPGSLLAPADLGALRAECEELVGRAIDDDELASYLMYPSVFVEFVAHADRFGNVGVLPTPVFFYGMDVMQELEIELERGKTLSVRFAALGEPDDAGNRIAYFDLNGQPRPVTVRDARRASAQAPARKAEPGNAKQIGAPMPGQIVKVAISEGLAVHKGDAVVTIEAMKMQTVIHAPVDGTIASVETRVGARVAAGDLLAEFT